MPVDLDTFLTTLYTVIDDLYKERIQPHMPPRPGPDPELSDSEVLTLAVLAQWARWPSERDFVRWAKAHLRPYFPRLVSQSRLNRRIRDLGMALGLLYREAAQRLAEISPYRVLDSTPVPVCKLPRRRRSPFLGDAAVSWCAAKSEWYFGYKLFLAVTPAGVITSAALLPANVGDRPGAASILEQDRYPCYLADKGFCSQTWEQEWAERYATQVVAAPFRRHKRAWSPETYRWMSGRRQIVDTVINLLKDRFGVERHRAKSRWGLWTRLAAKLAALTLGQWMNRQAHRPLLALATLCTW